MASLTVYPDYHPESTSVDGMVGRTGNEDWATKRTSGGNYAADSSTVPASPRLTCNDATTWSLLRRSIYTFDLATLPTGAVIDSATFGIYVSSKVNTLGATNTQGGIALVDATTATDTALANGDYQLVGTTRQATGDIAYDVISTGAYNVFTLTAAALLTLSDIVKFGVRLVCDLDNTEPATLATKDLNVTGRASEYNAPDRSQVPYLTVVYHIPATVVVTPVALTVVKQTPTVTGAAIATVTPKALTVTPQTVEVIALSGGTPATVDVIPVALEVETKALGVSAGCTIAVTPVALVVTVQTPVVVAGTSATIAVVPVTLDVVSQLVTTRAGFTTTIPPPALEVVTYAPVVTAGTSATIAVVPVALSVDAKIPAVSIFMGTAINIYGIANDIFCIDGIASDILYIDGRI